MNKFIPKNYKYKKIRKRVRINALNDYRTNTLKLYKYGLKVMSNGIISSIVLEAARRSITRKLKRTGNLRINGFSSIPITAKSLGVRMGKGVGSISG
jgi:large subunit ribosomal protein L16